jgi:hypothetical protein
MSVLDISDVAMVSEMDLAIAVNAIVSGGHASVFFKGPNPKARAYLDAELMAIYDVDSVTLSPVLVRFWSLVDALQHRRLQSLLLQNGHAILGQLAQAASTQRLNAQWGLNPQKLLMSVTESISPRTAVPPGPVQCDHELVSLVA